MFQGIVCLLMEMINSGQPYTIAVHKTYSSFAIMRKKLCHGNLAEFSFLTISGRQLNP